MKTEEETAQETQNQNAAPPAATVVVNGDRTEREIELEAKAKKEEKLRIDREKRIAELEDENHQLKQVRKATEAEQPAQPKPTGKGWRFTLMDTED